MSRIDWKDPEQVKACNAEYQRKWRELHRTELNKKAREANRNKPAAPGVKGRGARRQRMVGCGVLYGESVCRGNLMGHRQGENQEEC